MSIPTLAITAGEPAGIGIDLCIQLAVAPPDISFVVIADKYLLQQRASQLGIALQVRDAGSGEWKVESGNVPTYSHPPPHFLSVIHVPLAVPCRAGVLDKANSEYVLATLRRAVQGCQTGEFSGIVTAPVHKGIINDAGIPFTGHTEYLAEQTGSKSVVMMLVGGGMWRARHGDAQHSVRERTQRTRSTDRLDTTEAYCGMRVALATTHLALRDVPAAITALLLENVLHIIQRDLQHRFGIAQPRILVAGLNPHAGEGGYLGREEIEVMIPLLDKLRADGMRVSAPLPADTLFIPHQLAQCDCVLAMYHDQGLPVLKHASFGQGVNVTLGLPIIRTSVDHGTALDLAGTGKADSGSLLEAIRLAAQMAQNERDTNV
ncbi:MAG: 4-hydroxythreonine-4-phosphate dehydrogenase PdxA [Gallionellales bacterium GWA2_55_18]|nr:MAG: 4-hydroxythreonine-4-phosphate dehydrogenase PdxA [Gallionellales bacterium GWA2_55_18]